MLSEAVEFSLTKQYMLLLRWLCCSRCGDDAEVKGFFRSGKDRMTKHFHLNFL